MLCICSHPFFRHRCLSLSWKPTLQLAPPPFSGGLQPVHSCRDTKEPLSIATQWGTGQQRAEEGLSEVTQDALWSLLAGVILGERAGTSQSWWYQSTWERWEEVGAADTPSEEFCWKTKCKEARVHDCYHFNEELFPCFRFFFFYTGFWGCFWFVSFGTFGLFFSMWNLSSTTRDGIQPPALAVWSL